MHSDKMDPENPQFCRDIFANIVRRLPITDLETLAVINYKFYSECCEFSRTRLNHPYYPHRTIRMKKYSSGFNPLYMYCTIQTLVELDIGEFMQKYDGKSSPRQSIDYLFTADTLCITFDPEYSSNKELDIIYFDMSLSNSYAFDNGFSISREFKYISGLLWDNSDSYIFPGNIGKYGDYCLKLSDSPDLAAEIRKYPLAGRNERTAAILAKGKCDDYCKVGCSYCGKTATDETNIRKNLFFNYQKNQAMEMIQNICVKFLPKISASRQLRKLEYGGEELPWFSPELLKVKSFELFGVDSPRFYQNPYVKIVDINNNNHANGMLFDMKKMDNLEIIVVFVMPENPAYFTTASNLKYIVPVESGNDSIANYLSDCKNLVKICVGDIPENTKNEIFRMVEYKYAFEYVFAVINNVNLTDINAVISL